MGLLNTKALKRRDIALIHGVSLVTVDKWVTWGMPRRDDGTFSAPDTVRWRVLNSGTNGKVVDPDPWHED